jgi:hypothetical protein
MVRLPTQDQLTNGTRAGSNSAAPECPEDFLLERLRLMVRAELQPIRAGIFQLSSIFRQTILKQAEQSLDPRKQFIAEIIMSRPHMPVTQIFKEADRLSDQNPKKAHMQPPRAWKARSWSDMARIQRAQTWVSKIRANPHYVREEYLTASGKSRLLR